MGDARRGWGWVAVAVTALLLSCDDQGMSTAVDAAADRPDLGSEGSSPMEVARDHVTDPPESSPDMAPDLVDMSADKTPDLPPDVPPVTPPNPPCNWVGPQCMNGVTQVCTAGSLTGVQMCHALGCQNPTSCVPPGSPATLARQAQGVVSNPYCPANNIPPVAPANAQIRPNPLQMSCEQCVRKACCDPLSKCASNQACRDAWSCLQSCSSLAACDACIRNDGAAALAAVHACALSNCLECAIADPCAGVSSARNCGTRLPGGQADALYQCEQGRTVGAVTCHLGCVMGQGQPDHCAGSDPCLSAIYDGPNCGSTLGSPSGVPNVLYQCQAGATKGRTECQVCTQAAPGRPYECR
jgi:hypothetical protein